MAEADDDVYLISGGVFKTKKTSGAWADLVSDGTYSMRINERDGTPGKKVTITIVTISSLSASATVGGPFEGVSGPGYPTGPLDMDTGAVSMLLDRVGQVKTQGDKMEVKDRQYEANGSFPVTINGANLNATEIKVLSDLKLDAGTGDHQGTIDVDIDSVPGGHITLDYQGTATMTGDTIASAGTFETTETTGIFDGLVAEGTYVMTIVESGDTLGSGVIVTISTRSASTLPPPAGGTANGNALTLALIPVIAGSSGEAQLELRLDDAGGPELKVAVKADGLPPTRTVALCITGPDGNTFEADADDDRKDDETTVTLSQKLKVGFTSLSGMVLKVQDGSCSGATLLHVTVP